MPQSCRILYCRCRHASTIAPETTDGVLEGLCASGAAFEAVDDLCGLAARNPAALARLLETDDLRIAACHERAVELLLGLAEAENPPRLKLADMRTRSAEQVLETLLEGLKEEAGRGS
ncbi:MAG: hypothetical protein ACLFUJ_05125 [Phycisphaerae bacterium]